MQLHTVDAQSAPLQIRALQTVASAADGGPSRAHQAVVDAMREELFAAVTVAHAERAQAEVSPAALAGQGIGPDQARQLVRMMIVVSVADGPPSNAQAEYLTACANALGVKEPGVKVLTHLAAGRLMRFRFSFLPHSHVRHYFRNTYRMLGGLIPMMTAVLRFRGVLATDAPKVERYRALKELPQNTLGYRFYRHCVDAGIGFPGEKDGFPEGAIFHDVTHALIGHDTSAQGELKNAAFQAGYTRDDHDFFTWLFAMVLHGARVNMTPFPMPNIPQLLAEEGLARTMLQELRLGGRAKVDIGRAWDFWEYAELPLGDVCRQLGFPQRDPVGA